MYKTDFEGHVAKHEGKKQYQCTQCLCKFESRTNLPRHYQVCSKETPVCECEICGIKLKANATLMIIKKLMITRKDINVHHVAQRPSTNVL